MFNVHVFINNIGSIQAQSQQVANSIQEWAFNLRTLVFNMSSIRLQAQENRKSNQNSGAFNPYVCVFNMFSIQVQSHKIASSIQDCKFNVCSILAPLASLNQNANVSRLIPGVICAFGQVGGGGMGVSARSASKEHSLLAEVQKTFSQETASMTNVAQVLDSLILLSSSKPDMHFSFCVFGNPYSA